MRGRWVFLCAFAVSGVATIFLLHPPVSSQDWAAWFQAVGAVAGIAIAIIVPFRVHQASVKRDAEREAEAIRHDLQSVKDELDIELEGMRRMLSPYLEVDLPDGIYSYVMRPDVNSWVLYRAIAGRIGRIPQQDVRRGIVRTYALLQGLTMDFHTHADLSDQFNIARQGVERDPDSFAARQERDDARDVVRQFSGNMQASYKETLREVEALIIKIENALAEPVKNGKR